ncbi:MAG TPA: GNAT family N-acetyltransferase [Tepidiformaceae bacterium]|nr:GNAT family N-acetyltransferase [Tepidiformaceae bacterium]
MLKEDHETTGDELFAMQDGHVVRVRRIRPDDSERLREFHGRLSERSQRLRFFGAMKRLRESLADRLTTVDFVDRAAFVVSEPGDDAIHGVGRYERIDRVSAEVAFVVEDSYQGQGLATELLYHLASHARRQGIARFTAVTLVENRVMIEVFARSGFPMTVKMDPPVDEITLAIG